jgi:predicted dehydrogenase
MGGGILQRFGSHIIDLLQFLTDQKVIRVNGTVRTFVKNTDTIGGIRRISSDDCTTFQIEFDGGTFANVTLNSQLNGFNQEVFVCGGEGHLVARNGDLFCYTNGAEREEILFSDAADDSVTQIISDSSDEVNFIIAQL